MSGTIQTLRDLAAAKRDAAMQLDVSRLWSTGMRVVDIAVHIGRDPSTVSRVARMMGLEPRYKKEGCTNENYLASEAFRRGLSIKQLKGKIIETVVRDRMVDAVLDDDVPLVPGQ